MAGTPSFAELVRLSDREIQELLRDVDQKDLCIALKAASEELKEKNFNNISERVRKFIKEEMESLGTMTPEEIEAAQQRILKQAALVGEQGRISWPPG